MTKAVIYCRFSPRRDGDISESNEAQLDICRRYCEAKGYEIIDDFRDNELSGDDETRPGLWCAIDALKRDYVLVCYRHDRLVRGVFLEESIYRAVGKRKARIEFAEGQNYTDSPEDTLIRQIISAFNQYQKRINAARTRAAMLYYQASGRAMSASPPYGMKPGPSRIVEGRSGSKVWRTWVVCEEEQRIAERIVEMRQQGVSMRQIAMRLNDDGVLCRGHKWNHSSVRRVCIRAKMPTAG